MTIILGINAYHGDSSACLIKDGVILAAAEEERFRRIKHWAGFPSEAIKYCLLESNIDFSEIEHVAINQDGKANLSKKIGFTILNRPNLDLVIDRVVNKRKRVNIINDLSAIFGSNLACKIHWIEHHLAHLSSSFYVSPFKDAVLVSIDGFGDFASTAWGLGDDKKISIDGKVYFPHSLGIFYQAMTQWLGFYNYGDEYKVMGLAPYGEPKFMNEMRSIVQLQEDGTFRLSLDFFLHQKEKIKYVWNGGAPEVGVIYSNALTDLIGPARSKEEGLTKRHMDIAKSIQVMYEEALFHILNALHKKYGVDNLCLSGGCAMNSVANGKVYKNTPFKKMYIQSAAGDAGGAIGAAFAVWHQLGGTRNFLMSHSYYGPHYTDKDYDDLLGQKSEDLKKHRCVVELISREDDLCNKVAKAISEGQVVGWFQGRMEWGPRALGNRSILGDPRRGNMKDILNLKIKRRESFRPFAPSVIREEVSEWFDRDDDVPFMTQVYPIKREKHHLIPAVTHVDGTGRLQTVSKSENPRYHKLISAFQLITGIPMILNTSFNENEPVVCHPRDALECFLRTKMDILVMGNWCISRLSSQ